MSTTKKVVRKTIEDIQELCSEVDGITSAPTKYPTSLDTAVLPATITDLIEWTAGHAAAGFYRLDGIFETVVYVKARAQGEGIDEAKQECIELLEEMLAKFLNSNNLILNSSAPQISLRPEDDGFEGDGAHEILTYPPGGIKEYHGFRFRGRVMAKWSQ
jgi:hypothetical protein